MIALAYGASSTSALAAERSPPRPQHVLVGRRAFARVSIEIKRRTSGCQGDRGGGDYTTRRYMPG